jgi:outer membrane protein assembly factor BamE (lipoprotein component of BamABCDE complex)
MRVHPSSAPTSSPMKSTSPMLNSTRPLFAAALLALVVSSCAFGRNRVHEPIPQAAVSSLAIGDSALQVTEILGAPSEVVQLGKRSAYRYDYTETKQTGLFLVLVGFYNSDSHQDRVWVFFDESNNLTHVGATLQAESASHGMPWSE